MRGPHFAVKRHLDDLAEHDLDDLLAEDVAHAARREQLAFDQLVKPNSRGFVLFGAGNAGRRLLATFRAAGTEPLAFADNNRALWGRTVDGVQVVPPEAAAREFGRTATFVITI